MPGTEHTRFQWRTVLRVGLLVALGVVVWATRFGTRWPAVYVMTGPSMEPAVAAGEYFLAWSPVEQVESGDLVLFRFVDEGDTHEVLRRAVGLPGDTVTMARGTVLVNGARQPWPFLVHSVRASRSPLALVDDIYTWGPWVVPPDSVLLLADTRDVVGWPDSRFVGFVAQADLVARATRKLDGRRLR